MKYEMDGVTFRQYYIDFASLNYTNNPKYIILHHLAWHEASIVDVHKDHRFNRGWAGVGYHYLVRKNGTIEVGRPENATGAHCKEDHMNFQSIGVAFEGNYTDFDKQPIDYTMPKDQYEAGITLIKYLMEKYDIVYQRVRPHKYYSNKDCPGKYFPLSDMMKNIMPKKTKDHWAEKDYDFLVNMGLKISEKRFDDAMSRGEVFSMLRRAIEALDVKDKL